MEVAMSKDRTVYVTCPLCKGTLEVSTENGKVVRHFEARDKAQSGDALAEAVEAARTSAARTEEKFKVAQEQEKHKLKRLDETFREKKKEVEESGDTGRPVRPIDLD
jgi:adenine-specific DNA methylase